MQILIIGAGVAGLAAAQHLSAAGHEICMVEARNRIGGRIHTVHDQHLPIPVELGAEFIHGRPKEIFSITKASRLSTPEVSGPHRYARGGKLIEHYGAFSRANALFARMADPSLPDQTFAEFLNGAGADPEAQALARNYVEGFNAARADRISTRALREDMRASEAIDGERAFRLKEGYDCVPESLWRDCEARGVRLRLNTSVKVIEWRRGWVKLAAETAPSGMIEKITADCAVVTPPLAILKLPESMPAAIRFLPGLTQIRRALDRLKMGHAARITLLFRRAFWNSQPPLARPGFIHSDEKYFPTWWNALSPSAPAITGWSGGPKAESVADLSDAAIAERALESLTHILAVPNYTLADQIEAYFFHNWSSDPFAHGAYSYSRVGGIEARRVLASPAEQTLFFAGEATETEGHAATVHGAIASGYRAARQILVNSRQ